jgi:acyl-CoA thioesterase-2
VRVTAALDDLCALLDLERIDTDIFRGHSPHEERIRVFGGQVAGQALIAAGRTVADGYGVERPVHSLHAYFLRPGDPRVPIVYAVDRIRDGRSFNTRRVAAIQHGEPIFHLSASFHCSEPGVSHQAPMPAVPDPETLPTWRDRMAPFAGRLPWYDQPRPLDVRYVGEPVRTVPDASRRAPHHRLWLRADGRLPDDPLLHACVVAYASDMTLLDTVMLPHGLVWFEDGSTQVSLDHAMWFHRPFRADDWLLYEQTSPIASGGRGLADGTIFTRDGTLVVSVVQEGLIRPAQRAASST